MKRKYYGIWIVLVFAGLSLARCSKGYGPVDTTLTMYTYLQTKKTPSADTLYTDNWVAYYYYGDTNQYRLLSYDDALEGILTEKGGTATVKGTPAVVLDTTRVQFRNLGEVSVLMWIVQPDSMMYAWRQIDLVDGLDSMSMQLFFRTWQTSDYIENKWNVFIKTKANTP